MHECPTPYSFTLAPARSAGVRAKLFLSHVEGFVDGDSSVMLPQGLPSHVGEPLRRHER
jgi:hypothetical protein